MGIMLSQRTSIKKTDRKQNEETTTTSNKNRSNWQQERKSHVIHFALWRRRMITNVLPFIIHITHHVRFVFSAWYYSHRSYCFLWVCAIQCVCVCVYEYMFNNFKFNDVETLLYRLCSFIVFFAFSLSWLLCCLPNKISIWIFTRLESHLNISFFSFSTYRCQFMYGELTDKETIGRLEYTLENQLQDQFEMLLYKSNSKSKFSSPILSFDFSVFLLSIWCIRVQFAAVMDVIFI